MMNMTLRCQCGAVKGTLGPVSRVFNKRIVCMCRDCQAFAHFLDRAALMLDSNGGSEIIPVHPARLTFTQGVDQLFCVRLSDDGLRRWFTACCKTPVANTHPKNKLPFAGLHRSILEYSGDQALGPIYARINGHGAHNVMGATLSAIRLIGYGILRGLQKPWPFPDFKPTVGSDADYAGLIEKAKARSAATRRGP